MLNVDAPSIEYVQESQNLSLDNVDQKDKIVLNEEISNFLSVREYIYQYFNIEKVNYYSYESEQDVNTMIEFIIEFVQGNYLHTFEELFSNELLYNKTFGVNNG